MPNLVPPLPVHPTFQDDVPTKPAILRPATITVEDLEDAILDAAKRPQAREIDMILVEYLLDLDRVF